MYTWIWIAVLMYIGFLLMYFLVKTQGIHFNWEEFGNVLSQTKIKKKYLVRYYGVDKTTFRKWVKYFCSDIFPDPQMYYRKRTLNLEEALRVIMVLGIQESEVVYTKKAITEIGDGTYRSLKESIAKYPDQFGISLEVYANLRVFPPKLGKRILQQYG